MRKPRTNSRTTSARAPSVASVLREIRARRNPKNVEGMARFGINPRNTYGVTTAALRAMAKRIGRNHELALALWETDIHEARHLAAMLVDVDRITPALMERWAADFDSWDVCDGVCWHVFDRTPWAYSKAAAWSRRRSEFVRRGGFALMAGLAVHDKAAPDARFLAFLPLIERQADDDRNFVKKAVNWALRQIGKRNRRLHAAAIACAERIKARGTRAARWTATDALRELRSEATVRRIVC